MENFDEKLKEQKKRQREKRLIFLTLIFLIIATCVQVYYARLTFNNTPIPSNIIVFSLLNINIILILLLLFLIFRNLVKIFFDKEQKKIKKLSRKLVISFFLFTTIPLIVQFMISSVIIKSSITSWFNKKVEDNMQASLIIAQDYYEKKQAEATKYANKIYHLYFKNRRMIDRAARDYLLDGYIIGKKDKILKLKCFPDFLKKYIEPNIDKIKAIIINNNNSEGSDIILIRKKEIIYGFYKKGNYFAVSFFLTSRKITKASKTISQNFAEYSYLKLMKNPIQHTYLLSLLIVTMIIIFSATWFGFFIAKDISNPINELVKVTEEVSKGNLDYPIDIKSQDEIKLLVESFKKMVTELKSTRKNILERQQYIEAIINNVNSGVISISQKGIINTINYFVEKTLDIKKETMVGLHYNNINNETLRKIIKELLDEFLISQYHEINKNITVNIKGKIIILSIFATILKDDSGEILGYLIVMTDLTEITIAQRAAAWKEVARRVAHEIKNPLTPIQLSAQRLKKKYANALVENKDEFEKIINNIIQYVDVIRTLTNEFSKFAKMPDIKMEVHNLNDIVLEIMPFFKNSRKDIDFKISIDKKMPKVHLDKNQIYQVVTNILNNAIQSFENLTINYKVIEIKTKYDSESKKVFLSIADNGCGIDEKIKNKVFQPYFSTKKKGTGLGLSVVKSIVENHNGEIIIKDNKDRGTIVEITFFNV